MASPFSVTRSRLFGLPVLAGAGLVRELSVRTLHRIGSHVLFVCRVEDEQGHTDAQLAHVSAMYAERLTRMNFENSGCRFFHIELAPTIWTDLSLDALAGRRGHKKPTA